jgi:serine phosphatase RsbU (regulator of sigma subunit)
MISTKEEEINDLNREISDREQEIQDRSEEWATQQKDIREQRILMKEQEDILDSQRLQIEWQKNILIFFIILSVLILMVGFFIYRAYRIKKRASKIWKEKNRIIQDQKAILTNQKEEITVQRDQLQKVNKEIEKQNENITAGIYYALTIQQSILPDEDEINKYFDAFVIFYPKDIVSGDFYWFSHLGRKKSGEETSFIALVDCTGHGVPGGFLSMIGSRLLSAIVNENKIYQTDRILEIMDKRVRQALNQQKTENDDGMDISICKIVKVYSEQGKEQKIYASFSGARQHMFLVRNDQPVEIIRATRRSIGGKHFIPEPFTKHELVLEAGDKIYLTTDGLMDQQSPSRDRFGSPRFIKFLNDHHGLPVEEQKRKLEEMMIGFMKIEKQRDDITIMGIKL